MPTPAVTRELSFTYAGVTFGGTNGSLQIHGNHTIEGGYEDSLFTAQVMVIGSSEADFATQCGNLETAFSTPNGSLVITFGSTTFNSFASPARFLARPTFRRVSGPEDSARARLYEVSARFQNHANLSGKDGLRLGSLTVKIDPFGHKTYRVTGTYTRLGGNGAYAQYLASIGAVLTTLETLIGGTWLRTENESTKDDTDSLCSFAYSGVQNGIRDGSFQVDTLVDGTRRYRASGTYTRTDATTGTARAAYVAAISAVLTTFETALTGTWLRTESQATTDDADNFCRFTVTAIETSNLKEAKYEVFTSTEGILSYRISGLYTKTGSTGATAYYTANISGLLTAIEATLGGGAGWERQDSGYQVDNVDKFLRFSSGATQLIFNEAAGVLDNAAIKNPSLVVSRTHIAPGDAAGVSRPVSLIILYSCSVDKAQTTNLKGLWDATIKPYLTVYAQSLADGGQAALLRSTPSFDPTRNRISAQMEVEVYSGSTIIAHRVRTRDDVTEPTVLWGVWDGDPDTYDEPGEGKRVTLRYVFDERAYAGVPEEIAPPPSASRGSAGYRLLKTIRDNSPVVRGLPELNATITTTSTIFIFQKVKKSGGGGGGVGTVTSTSIRETPAVGQNAKPISGRP